MFFSSLPGMKISCDVPEMGWSQKMVEGWFSSTHDLCQLKPISRRIHSRQIRWHLEAPAFGAFCNEIQWLRSPYYPKMMLIVQYLYWCFVSSFHNKYEATQDIFLRTDWPKSSDIYQTSLAPCMLTILRSKSGMNGHSKRRLGVSLNCEKSDTKLCLYISVGSKESRWALPKSNSLKHVFINYIFDGLFCVGKSAISHPHCHSWVITCR